MGSNAYITISNYILHFNTKSKSMMQNFTHYDLVAYIYGEAAPSQIRKSEHAISGDPLVANEFTDLTIAKESLPRVKFNAPRRVLNQILGHSENTHHCAVC
jgi:hypothetical protein